MFSFSISAFVGVTTSLHSKKKICETTCAVVITGYTLDGTAPNISNEVTGRPRLIRSHSSARFCFELSGNSN